MEMGERRGSEVDKTDGHGMVEIREKITIGGDREESPGNKEERTEAAGQAGVTSWAAGQHGGSVLPVHHHGGE